MEQPTSRPSYLYLPKLIEQQLTAYQLGTLLEVYKRGWYWNPKAGDDRRPSKLFGLLFIIVGVGGLILSIIVIYNVIQSTGIIVTSIGLIALIPAFFAWVGLFLLFQTSHCVGAFQKGIVYAKGTHVTVLHWAEIESCEQSTIKRWYGTLHLLRVRTHDNKSIQVRAAYYQLEKLSKIISESIA